jgi:NAD(P)H-dependent FMN reductase
MRGERNSAMRSKPLNVLILLGSPREDGNSSRLAFAFADAASRNGHRVQSVRLSRARNRPLRRLPALLAQGFAALRRPRRHGFRLSLLRAADVLVFATPLHFYTWSAPVKLLTDRLVCLAPTSRATSRASAPFCWRPAPTTGPAAFAGLRATYRLVAEYMGWKRLGELCVGRLEAEDDVSRAPRALARADALGARLA